MGIESSATQLLDTINGLAKPWQTVSVKLASMCDKLISMIDLDDVVAGLEERAKQSDETHNAMVNFALQAKKLIAANSVDRLSKLCNQVIQEYGDGS